MKALTSVHARLVNYIPQYRPSCQAKHQDGHTSIFFRDIVNSNGWAEQVVATRLTTQGQSKSMDYSFFLDMHTCIIVKTKNPKVTLRTVFYTVSATGALNQKEKAGLKEVELITGDPVTESVDLLHSECTGSFEAMPTL